MLKRFFSVTINLSENTLLNYVLDAQLFPRPTRTSHNTPSLTYIKDIVYWKIIIIIIYYYYYYYYYYYIINNYMNRRIS